MSIYEEWKKDIEEKFKGVMDTEEIPQVIKRCPKCNELSLEFDIKTGKIHCTKCNFEENIPIFGDEKKK